MCEKEGEREREREFISLLLTMATFLFLKGMMGALAPFNYLVEIIMTVNRRLG